MRLVVGKRVKGKYKGTISKTYVLQSTHARHFTSYNEMQISDCTRKHGPQWDPFRASHIILGGAGVVVVLQAQQPAGVGSSDQRLALAFIPAPSNT